MNTFYLSTFLCHPMLLSTILAKMLSGVEYSTSERYSNRNIALLHCAFHRKEGNTLHFREKSK